MGDAAPAGRLIKSRRSLAAPPFGFTGARHEAPEADPQTIEQQESEALALLAETALHHDVDAGAPGERDQVVAHVDSAVLADADQPG